MYLNIFGANTYLWVMESINCQREEYVDSFWYANIFCDNSERGGDNSEHSDR